MKLAFDGNGGDFLGFLKATGNFKTLVIYTNYFHVEQVLKVSGLRQR